MGKLRDIQIRTIPVFVDEEQSFDVRGLSASDVAALVQTHGMALSMAFGKVVAERSNGPGSINEAMVKDVLIKAATDMPEVLAAMIALAADSYEVEFIEVARRLPLMAQVAAGVAIFKLSMSSESELKKLVESLTAGMAQMSAALQGVKLPSLSGIGISDAA